MGLLRTLGEKPWLSPSSQGSSAGTVARQLPSERIGLRFFLMMVGILFSLITSVYFMRMSFPDWEPLADPRLLWLNTGLLALASLALETARRAARRREGKRVRQGLLLGGLLGVAFLAGQLLAWRQLVEAGYFATTNPANSFFYLITGLHWIHIMGGVIAWMRTSGRLRADGAGGGRTRLSLDLCAVYWHFLLLVWIAMFALLLTT